MHYKFSFVNPSSRYVQLTVLAENIAADITYIQLPAWRPGRYELGNFAKNVRNFKVYDQSGKEIAANKVTKDKWKLHTIGVKSLSIQYEYYAADLNAGSTFLDATQLYVNPVNCCVYLEGRLDEACTVELAVPEKWKVATAMKSSKESGSSGAGGHQFTVANFDRLADSPFIASPTLKHNYFILDGVEFHLWFQGECKPEWSKLINDFFIFVNENMLVFGTFPAEEYHFLFQILPHRFYHGVEHVDSTVVGLGPSYKLMTELYDDLLGVSCHELFHAWNIKSIRPAEMLPYDFTKENYSRLGFVSEGVTTYYGDYLLYRSGVWTAEQFWPTFNERMDKHFETEARKFLSVADSSLDTWLDGYVPGAPHRKTSIYHEGCLLAFVTDIFIRKNSGNKKSLDAVMRRLWEEFAQQGRGYSEADYKKLIEEEAGADFSYYWNNYFFKANDYTPVLAEALDYIGHKFELVNVRKVHEHKFGFKVNEAGGITRVTEMYYGSPAESAGLAVGDEIILIDGQQVKNDMNEWMVYFGGDEHVLKVNSIGIVRDIVLKADGESWYPNPVVRRLATMTEAQKGNFSAWSGKKA
ncbi:MAG TPA: PDZ domain-containing protein [Bacteroidia bacterium]|nr:PDZ domain-containing protein [Bacteroidia bacterium]